MCRVEMDPRNVRFLYTQIVPDAIPYRPDPTHNMRMLEAAERRQREAIENDDDLDEMEWEDEVIR